MSTAEISARAEMSAGVMKIERGHDLHEIAL
jgi:hypothetical protein